MSPSTDNMLSGLHDEGWRLLVNLDEVFFGCLLPRPQSQQRDDPQLRQIKLSLWRLRRAFQRLVGPAEQQALKELLRQAGPNIGTFRDDFLVWIDFIEELIQGAERALGPQPGRGPRKVKLVKGALLYWIRKNHIQMPGISEFFEPFVSDLIVEIMVAIIVQVANSEGLWALDEPHPPASLTRATVFGWVAGLLHGLVSKLDDLAWWFLTREYPLDAHVTAAVDRLGPAASEVLVRRARGSLELVTWVINHRRVFTDLVDLLVLAANEAEGFLELSGDQKRAYARRYILEFLIEAGVLAPDGIMRMIAESFLDFAIDSVVHLLKKRGGLPNRRVPGLPASA